MTTDKNIHPVYFNSFVGTWKRMPSKGSPSTKGYLKFNRDCTFEHDGTFNPLEGTINGDVDEISVEDDGHNYDERRKIGKAILTEAIKGTAILTENSKKQKWSYRIIKGSKAGLNSNTRLEFRRNNARVIYVGNLPLSEEKTKKTSKKK